MSIWAMVQPGMTFLGALLQLQDLYVLWEQHHSMGWRFFWWFVVESLKCSLFASMDVSTHWQATATRLSQRCWRDCEGHGHSGPKVWKSPLVDLVIQSFFPLWPPKPWRSCKPWSCSHQDIHTSIEVPPLFATSGGAALSWMGTKAVFSWWTGRI